VTATKARHGAWTPWAAVLCVECEYATLQGQASYPRRLQALKSMQRAAEVGCPEGDLEAVCNTCRCACWVRSDVALLQQIGYQTSELDWEGPFGWALEQTGGMCSALVLATAKHEIVVTAMDGDFFIGAYAKGDDSDERWMEPLRTWQSEALYEDSVLKPEALLKTLVEQCAKKAIEFIYAPNGPETSAA
jgi:hypothetical protein